MLDILDRYHAKATFFVTGNGQKYNYLIQEAHKRGNTIALHTYCHDYRTVYASTDAYFNDLNKVGEWLRVLLDLLLVILDSLEEVLIQFLDIILQVFE